MKKVAVAHPCILYRKFHSAYDMHARNVVLFMPKRRIKFNMQQRGTETTISNGHVIDSYAELPETYYAEL